MKFGGFKFRSAAGAVATACVLAAGLSAAPAMAASNDDTVTMLGLWPMSGAYADMGPLMDRGAKIAIEQNDGKVDGKKINYITRDSETKAGVAARRTQAAIDSDNAQFIVGPWSSGVALAVDEVARKNKALYYFSGGTADISGKRCNRYVFQWAANAWTAMNADLKYLKKTHPNVKTIYLFVVNYTFGWSLQQYVEELAPKYGIKVVGVSRQPLGERDFSSFITKAMATNPDAIYMVNFGLDAISAVRQLHNFGFTPQKPVVMSWSSGVEELEQMTPEMRANLVVGTNYYYTLDTPGNKAFVKAYEEKSGGVPPGYAPAAAYGQMKLILRAMQAAGSTDPKAVATALEHMKGQTLIGDFHVNAWNHQTVRPYFVLQTKPDSEMANKYDFAKIIGQSAQEQPKQINECKDIGSF